MTTTLQTQVKTYNADGTGYGLPSQPLTVTVEDQGITVDLKSATRPDNGANVFIERRKDRWVIVIGDDGDSEIIAAVCDDGTVIQGTTGEVHRT